MFLKAFLRDPLYRYLQFHSSLCHHTGCSSTVASSEFQGLQEKKKKKEELPADGQQEPAVVHMADTYRKAFKYRYIKADRKFPKSVFRKPQALFLCCTPAGRPSKEILDCTRFPVSTTQSHELFSLIMLLVFLRWYPVTLKVCSWNHKHSIPQKAFSFS